MIDMDDGLAALDHFCSANVAGMDDVVEFGELLRGAEERVSEIMPTLIVAPYQASMEPRSVIVSGLFGVLGVGCAE